MFDNPRAGSLDSTRFVDRNHEPILQVRAILPFLVISLCGCSPRSAPGTVEDSITSGRISIACAPEAYDLIRREQAAFSALYPRATVDVRVASSREAIGELFAARCDLAVIARELEQEERRAAIQGGLELAGYRFARDAIVMVVHPNNRVENAAIEDVRRVYRGEISRWAALGGTNESILPVVQPLASDITEFFVQQVMGGEPIHARVLYEDSDSGVVNRVKGEPNAFGYVTLAWANRGAKALRLASLTGLPYWKPDLEAVYREEYPLTRFFNMYTRASGPKLANGFITFVTSFEGQKLVYESHFVPTTIPVRFVRRSPMISSH